MLRGLLDLHIPVFLALLGVCALAGQAIARHWGFFRDLVDARRADPRFEPHLEGLRGILAYGVFMHHAAYTWEDLQHGGWYAHEPPSHFLVLIGGASVSMFFFLTGYLFWTTFLQRGAAGFAVGPFYRKRLLRIGPAYWLFCALMLLTVTLDAGGALRTSLTEWVVSVVQWLAFGAPLGHFPDVNGYALTRLINGDVAWSLRHELLYYLLLPALIPFARGRRTLWLVGAFAAVLVALKLLAARTALAPGLPQQILHDGLIEFSKFLLIGFAPGMLTAWALQQAAMQALLQRVRPVLALGLLLSCLLLLLLNTGSALLKLLPLWGIFFLIAARAVPLGWLRSRGLMVMGLASYSIYLFHGVFLFLLLPRGLDLYRRLGQPGEAGYWLLIAGAGVLVLAACALIYRWIEFPFLQRSRRARPRHRPLPQA